MAIFVTQGGFTREYIRGGLARAATVISLAASGGDGIQDVVTMQAFIATEARALFEQAGGRRLLQTDRSFLRTADGDPG
jgi:hypothetical protein